MEQVWGIKGAMQSIGVPALNPRLSTRMVSVPTCSSLESKVVDSSSIPNKYIATHIGCGTVARN